MLRQKQALASFHQLVEGADLRIFNEHRTCVATKVPGAPCDIAAAQVSARPSVLNGLWPGKPTSNCAESPVSAAA